jgi:hypothetical protein
MKLKQKSKQSKHLLNCKRRYRHSVKGRYSALLHKAKQRRLPLTISLEEYSDIILHAPCSYCGGKIGTGGYGLDRINAKKGYTKNNVIPACAHCNIMKHAEITAKEMKILVDILKHLRHNPKQLWSNKGPNKKRRK